jgi:hypothetical protein
MKTQTVYILIDITENKPISIDTMSGGYPYTVDSLHRAQMFLDRESAERYRNHFKDSLVMKRMTLTLEKE